MIEIKITTNNPHNYIFLLIRLKIGKNKGVTANAGTFFITLKNLIFLKIFHAANSNPLHAKIFFN